MPKVDFIVSDILDLPHGWADDCDLTYTDPPWEQGLVKMFETMKFKQTGEDRAGNAIDDILDKLFKLHPAGKPCFIEYGVKGFGRVIDHGKANGLVFTGAFEAVQTNGSPYMMVQFNTDMPVPSLEGRTGWELMKSCLSHHNPTKVFEPFAGHGQHTRRMVAFGCDVRASEFNAARAAKLVKALKL